MKEKDSLLKESQWKTVPGKIVKKATLNQNESANTGNKPPVNPYKALENTDVKTCTTIGTMDHSTKKKRAAQDESSDEEKLAPHAKRTKQPGMVEDTMEESESAIDYDTDVNMDDSQGDHTNNNTTANCNCPPDRRDRCSHDGA